MQSASAPISAANPGGKSMSELANQKRNIICFLVSLFIPSLIWFIPVSEVFTESLRLYFMITLFVIMLMAFEVVPILVSGMLFGTLYFLSGIVDVQTAFSYWTTTMTWMIFGGLVFSAVLEQCGLLKRIAYWIIYKCGGSFNGAVFGVFFVGIVLNIITFCNGWIVACVLVYGLCKSMDMPRSHQAGLVCFAGAIGANGSVIYLYHPAFVSLIESSLKQHISPDAMIGLFTPFQYIGFAVPCCLLTIWIFMKIYRTSEMKERFNKQVIEEKLKSCGKMSRAEIIATGFTIVLMIYLISCQFTRLSPAYGFMIIPWLMFIPGLGLGNGETIKRANVPSIFFIAACLGIGIVGAKVGFGEFITQIAVPLLSGYGKLTICLFFMLFGVLANLLMTPLAMLACLVVPFIQIATALDINPLAACFILQYTIDMVFLPHEASGNLIMYSYGLWPMKDFIIQNTVKTAINAIIFVAIMYPLWCMFNMV